MTNLNYIKNNFRFWVLQTTLLLSVFVFTGYNAKAELPISESSQTELILSKKKASKKVISLKKANSTLSVYYTFPKQLKFQKVDLKLYQQFLMVKIQASFLKFIGYQKPTFFLQKRIFSTTSDLDFPIFSFL